MVCHPYYIGLEQPLNIIFVLINTTCAIISVLGSGIVIYAVMTVKSLQNPSNWLLMALASADLLAGAIAQPMYGIHFAFFHYSNRCNIEKAAVFMSAASCSTSMLILCVIAQDRYLHISRGFTYNQFVSGLKILFQAVVTWVIGLATAELFMLKGSGFKQFIGFAVFSAVQMFSFIYISVIYFQIKKYLQTHFREMSDTLDTNGE